MLIVSIYCKNCMDIVFSRSRHDFSECSCGCVAIDGGSDYVKVSTLGNEYKMVKLESNIEKKELYDDWNLRKDFYGKINYKSLDKNKTIDINTFYFKLLEDIE